MRLSTREIGVLAATAVVFNTVFVLIVVAFAKDKLFN